jgi:hypothetical protein
MLTEPNTPRVSGTRITVFQSLTVTGKLPSSGTGPYAWLWEVSVNGGGFSAATMCSADSGTGGSAGQSVVCSIGGSTLTAGDTYVFVLQVTDSATVHELADSPDSPTVTVVS